MQNIKFKYNLI